MALALIVGMVGVACRYHAGLGWPTHEWEHVEVCGIHKLLDRSVRGVASAVHRTSVVPV